MFVLSLMTSLGTLDTLELHQQRKRRMVEIKEAKSLPESTAAAHVTNAIVITPVLEPTVEVRESAEHLASSPVGGQRS